MQGMVNIKQEFLNKFGSPLQNKDDNLVLNTQSTREIWEWIENQALHQQREEITEKLWILKHDDEEYLGNKDDFEDGYNQALDQAIQVIKDME